MSNKKNLNRKLYLNNTKKILQNIAEGKYCTIKKCPVHKYRNLME